MAPVTPYEIEALHETYSEVQSKLNRVANFLTRWGLTPVEIVSEVFVAFCHAYRKYDPERGKPFEVYAAETVYYLTRSNVRERLQSQWELSKQQEYIGDGWEFEVPCPQDDYGSTVADGLDTLLGDGLSIVRLVLDPPAPLWELVQKWSSYGQTTAKYAWRKALSEYLKTKHWSKTPWTNERIKAAFDSVSDAIYLKGE